LPKEADIAAEGTMADTTVDITGAMATTAIMGITMATGMATAGTDMGGMDGTATGMRSIIGVLATPGAIGTGMVGV